jgi:glycylpeptide N-tetradecanoyltransferase
MVAADVPSACRLLNAHLSKFQLVTVYDEADFAHWFLPRDDVIRSFVVEVPVFFVHAILNLSRRAA